MLALKLKRRVPIVLGILVATLASHFLAGYAGAWLVLRFSPDALKRAVAHLAPENVRAAVAVLEGGESRLSHVAQDARGAGSKGLR